MQTPVGESGDPGDARPQVEDDGPERRLVLAQAGEAGSVRGRDHRRDIEMAALDRRQEIVQGRAGHAHQVHRDVQAVADHAARVAQARAVVHGDLHRQGMQNLAPLAARLRLGEHQSMADVRRRDRATAQVEVDGLDHRLQAAAGKAEHDLAHRAPGLLLGFVHDRKDRRLGRLGIHDPAGAQAFR